MHMTTVQGTSIAMFPVLVARIAMITHIMITPFTTMITPFTTMTITTMTTVTMLPSRPTHNHLPAPSIRTNMSIKGWA